jgi:hypothetical protein
MPTIERTFGSDLVSVPVPSPKSKSVNALFSVLLSVVSTGVGVVRHDAGLPLQQVRKHISVSTME